MKHTDINYTVRESLRAKRVILKVRSNGLEVVVPRRFGRRKIPGVIEAHRQWIENELQRVIDVSPVIAPRCIDLNAVGESWRINYVSHLAYDGKCQLEKTPRTGF